MCAFGGTRWADAIRGDTDEPRFSGADGGADVVKCDHETIEGVRKMMNDNCY